MTGPRPPLTDPHGRVYLTEGFITTLNLRLDRLEAKLDWLYWKLTYVPPTEPIRSQAEGNRIVGIRMLPAEQRPWPGDKP
jgi:hypothetical protein